MELSLFIAMIWACLIIFALTLNSALGFWYSYKMVFHVLKPSNVDGPLHGAAVELVKQDPDLMLTRRAYALEAWLNGPIAAIGTAVLPLMILYTISIFPG